MTSRTIRDAQADHLLTPENAALLLIDYQPLQGRSIVSMDQREMVANVVRVARLARAFGLPTIPSRIQQAGGQPTSWVQLACELQRDWNRSSTASDFRSILFGSGAGCVRQEPQGGEG